VAYVFYEIGKNTAKSNISERSTIDSDRQDLSLHATNVRSPKETAENCPTTYKLIDDGWLHFEGKTKDTGLGIHRTQNMDYIKSIGVFNPQKSVLYSSFFPENGCVKSIEFKNYGKLIRGWTFRMNGSIESETVYEKDGRTGHKTYYREDGTKDREEKFILMHGS
jgi:antitoxin component YwqK of YwqJK toxin-antitoxin module